jgi:hypothetical protein
MSVDVVYSSSGRHMVSSPFRVLVLTLSCANSVYHGYCQPRLPATGYEYNACCRMTTCVYSAFWRFFLIFLPGDCVLSVYYQLLLHNLLPTGFFLLCSCWLCELCTLPNVDCDHITEALFTVFTWPPANCVNQKIIEVYKDCYATWTKLKDLR